MNSSRKKSPSEFQLVAEIGPNHNGSHDAAIDLIHAAADAGATAVKFQYRMADFEIFDKTTKSYYYDESRYDFIKRVQEFTVPQHEALRRKADELNLHYIASAMSAEVVSEIAALDPYAIKLPSGEFDNFLLFEALVKSQQDVILSTGMASPEEIDDMVKFFSPEKTTILHCLSEYPTSLSDMNLLFIRKLRERYNCRVGLSDHSRNIAQMGMVPALGGEMIEFHFTFDREDQGPDHHVSLLPQEVRYLRDLIDQNLIALGKEQKVLGSHADAMRTSFGNSICAKVDLSIGDIVEVNNICLMKPRTGIPASDFQKIKGKRLVKNVEARQPLSINDLE